MVASHDSKQLNRASSSLPHLVEVRVEQKLVCVDIASRDLHIHVPVRVRTIDDRDHLAILGVDFARHVFHLDLRLSVRWDLDLCGFAGHHLVDGRVNQQQQQQ